MNIRFFNHGKGNAKKAADYVISDIDHKKILRADVNVLRGDPEIFTAICQANPHKWKYTSGVIAFAPSDNPTKEQIQEVLTRFEEVAFSGIEPENYYLFATQHTEKDGSKHIHILVPRLELNTLKSLNIAPPGHEHYYSPFRDYFNYKYGWARPDDPLRAKNLKEPKFKKKEFLIHINEYIEQLVLMDLINNQADIVQAIKEYPSVINARPSKNYIAIDLKDGKTHRIKGALYEAGFQFSTYYANRAKQTNTSDIPRGTQDTSDYAIKRTAEYEQRFKHLAQQRREYNQTYYSSPRKQLQYVRTDRNKPNIHQSDFRTPESQFDRPQSGGRVTESIKQSTDYQSRNLSSEYESKNRSKAYRYKEYDQKTLFSYFLNESMDHSNIGSLLYDISNQVISPNYRHTESNDREQFTDITRTSTKNDKEIDFENRAKYAIDRASRITDPSQRTATPEYEEYCRQVQQSNTALREIDRRFRTKEPTFSSTESIINQTDRQLPDFTQTFTDIRTRLTNGIKEYDQQIEYQGRETDSKYIAKHGSIRDKQPDKGINRTALSAIRIRRELSRDIERFDSKIIIQALTKVELRIKEDKKKPKNNDLENNRNDFD